MGRDYQRWTTEQNIFRFREKLLCEDDVLKRKMLEGLLAREESKLVKKPDNDPEVPAENLSLRRPCKRKKRRIANSDRCLSRSNDQRCCRSRFRKYRTEVQSPISSAVELLPPASCLFRKTGPAR